MPHHIACSTDMPNMPIDVCSWAEKYTPVFFIFIKQTNQTVNWIEGSGQEEEEISRI